MSIYPEYYPTEPKELWRIFYDFTQTPRSSKNEEKIISYLKKVANENNLKNIVDKAGNIIIYVPGRNGRENDEPLIIQNHVDMVTDALPGNEINFLTDPLDIFVDNGWVKARGTTLGADNGIGCAAALSLIYNKDLVHPPLELLFTVDEETGLNGALGLEHKYLSGKKMLNLDTEEWGSLYVGCAGGIDYELTKKLQLVPRDKIKSTYHLTVSGFVGGHSGVDIHEQRGSALKFLAEYLNILCERGIDFEIEEINGGKAHNIIPRDAKVKINIESYCLEEVVHLGEQLIRCWKSFLPRIDQAFKISWDQARHEEHLVLSKEDRNKLIDYMLLFPHGVHSYDVEDKNLVATSNNFARLLVMKGQIYTQSSLRFFDRNEIRSIESHIQTLGRLFGMEVQNHSEYPSWKPTRENPVLEKVKDVYRNIYHKEAHVTAIHAGLECGILRDKIGPIDVISFGPTIMGAHSPDERVNIESVEKFWNLFTSILKII